MTDEKDLSFFILNIPDMYEDIHDYMSRNTGVVPIKNDTVLQSVFVNSNKYKKLMTRKDGGIDFTFVPDERGGGGFDGGMLGEVVVTAPAPPSETPNVPSSPPPTLPSIVTPTNPGKGGNSGGGGAPSSNSQSSGSNTADLPFQDYYTEYVPGLDNILLQNSDREIGVYVPMKLMTPIPYTERETRATFSKPNLKGFDMAQSGPYCVLSSCAYVKANFFTGNSFTTEFKAFFKKLGLFDEKIYKESFNEDGFRTEHAWEFIDATFNHQKTYGNKGEDEVKSETAIKKGNEEALKTCKQNIQDGKAILLVYRPDITVDNGHVIVVVGYVGDDLIYADPNVKDHLLQVHKDYFKFIYYTYTINSLKK